MRAVWMGMGLAVALMGCAAAQEADVAPEAETYSGLFRQGFEQSAFYPDAGGGPWWLTYDGDLWSRIEPFATGTGRGVAVVARMEVEGAASPTTQYEYLGGYTHELIVTGIVSVEAASEAEFQAAAEAARSD